MAIVQPRAALPQVDIESLGLPAHVVALLAGEGILSAEDWRRAGGRRYRIFGVTSGMARQLDVATRAVRT